LTTPTGASRRKTRAETVLTPHPAAGRLAAETAVRSTTMQIFEGTNQIQRLVISRDLARG
jgi:alkylation response protein AidB-like acyl-CoA dehydrogenase